MGKPLLMVSSVTYAIKGRDILARSGIKGYVLRVPKGSETGCGYGILVPHGADAAEKILNDAGVRVIKRTEQGESG